MSQNEQRHDRAKICKQPHVLVICPDVGYGNAVVSALSGYTVRAKHAQTVEDFLNLGCRTRVDVVALEVDVFGHTALDDLIHLRTHFGEGPGTKIVAINEYAPRWFLEQVQQQGADQHLTRLDDPERMAAILDHQARKHTGRSYE